MPADETTQHPVSKWLLTHNGLFAILWPTKNKFLSLYSRLFDDDLLIKKVKELYMLYNHENYHDGTQLFLSTLEKKIAESIADGKMNVYKYTDKEVRTPNEFTVSAIGVFDTVPAIGEGFNFVPRSLSSGTLVYHDPSDHRTDLYA